MTAKGYWIARIDVKDPEKMKPYTAAAAAAISAYGGRYLARGGKMHAAEGTHRSRNVVVEFPTYAAAYACWHSAEYQDAIRLRKCHADGDFIVLEGC